MRVSGGWGVATGSTGTTGSTGGSGIGGTIVSMLAAQGAKVAFIDIAADASAALADAIAARGHPKPWWQACDVRDVPALIDRLLEEYRLRDDVRWTISTG